MEFMQRLHHCVNIVPVIGKSDTLTIEERDLFKQRVSQAFSRLAVGGVAELCVGVTSCWFAGVDS